MATITNTPIARLQFEVDRHAGGDRLRATQELLDDFIERRRANAATLETALGDVDWLSLPVVADRGRSSWCGDPLDERQKGEGAAPDPETHERRQHR